MADTKVKLTHESFIRRCKVKGLNVEKITRNYVYMDKNAPKKKAKPRRKPRPAIMRLKNETPGMSSFCAGVLKEITINGNWKDGNDTLKSVIK